MSTKLLIWLTMKSFLCVGKCWWMIELITGHNNHVRTSQISTRPTQSLNYLTSNSCKVHGCIIISFWGWKFVVNVSGVEAWACKVRCCYVLYKTLVFENFVKTYLAKHLHWIPPLLEHKFSLVCFIVRKKPLLPKLPLGLSFLAIDKER